MWPATKLEPSGCPRLEEPLHAAAHCRLRVPAPLLLLRTLALKLGVSKASAMPVPLIWVGGRGAVWMGPYAERRKTEGRARATISAGVGGEEGGRVGGERRTFLCRLRHRRRGSMGREGRTMGGSVALYLGGSVVLLRVTIVNRTYGTDKTYTRYFSFFLLTIFVLFTIDPP